MPAPGTAPDSTMYVVVVHDGRDRLGHLPRERVTDGQQDDVLIIDAYKGDRESQ